MIVYQAPWMDPWGQLPQDSVREQQMVATLHARRFDGANLHLLPPERAARGYLAYLADVPLRLAASVDGPGSLLTTRHKHPEQMMHEVERGLDLVGAVGLGTAERDLVLAVPPAARATVADLLAARGLAGRRPLVVLTPAAACRRARIRGSSTRRSRTCSWSG